MKKYLISLLFAAIFFIVPAHAADLFPVYKPSTTVSLWAYMDEQGSLATSFQYFDASPFNEHGLATVKDINGFVSVINDKLETVVTPQKAPISVDFGADMLAFRYKDQSVYYDFSGNLIGSFPVNDGFFSEGLMPAQKDGLWGYINIDGQFEIEPMYLSAGDFENGFAVVKLSDTRNYGVITKNNIACILPKNTVPKYMRVFSSDIMVLSDGGFDWLYSLSSSELINDVPYQEIGEFNNGFAPARMNNMWGIISLKGKNSVAMKYYDLSYIGNGLYSARGTSDTSGTCSVITSTGQLLYRTDVYVSGFNSVSNGVLWHGTLSNQIIFISEKGGFMSSFENAEDPVIFTDTAAKITVENKVKYVNIKTGDVIYIPENDYSFNDFKVKTASYEKYIGVGNEWSLTYPVLSEMADKDVQNKINLQIQSFFMEGPKIPLEGQSLKGTFGISQAGQVVVVWADCVYGSGNGSAIWNESIALDLSDGTKYNVITDLFTNDYVETVKKFLPEEIPFYMFSYPRISSTGVTFHYNLSQDNKSERYFPTSKEYFIPYSSIDNVINTDGKFYKAIKGERPSSEIKDFSDVPKEHWAYDAIQTVSKLELMNGDNGNFSPDKPITGIEATAVMVRFLELDTSSISVPDGSPWYYKELYVADEAGLLNGISQDNLTNYINREDTMQIIVNSFESDFTQPTDEEKEKLLSSFSDSEEISQDRLSAVTVCVNQKIISGSDGLISPTKTLSR